MSASNNIQFVNWILLKILYRNVDNLLFAENAQSCILSPVLQKKFEKTAALLACCCQGCIVHVQAHVYANLSVKMWCHGLDTNCFQNTLTAKKG